MPSIAKRIRRLLPLIALATAVLAGVGVVAFVVLAMAGGGEPSGPRAAIVDQLFLTAPGQPFVDEATSMLEGAGYAVDYVPYEEVNVDFYRNLPTHDYDVVLLRAHAGLRRAEDGTLTGDAHLFTSETHSWKKYVDEQADGRLKAAAYNRAAIAKGEFFFAIPESFVTDSMRGNFGGAAVVLMGCDVFLSEKLAEAFVERGAGAVVGWDDLVTAAHTDAATLAWLRYYLDDDMSAQDAAAAARTEVGSDPYTGAEFLSYPPVTSSSE